MLYHLLTLFLQYSNVKIKASHVTSQWFRPIGCNIFKKYIFILQVPIYDIIQLLYTLDIPIQIYQIHDGRCKYKINIYNKFCIHTHAGNLNFKIWQATDDTKADPLLLFLNLPAVSLTYRKSHKVTIKSREFKGN